MSFSRKLYLLTLITASLSMNSFCSENTPVTIEKEQKESSFLVTYAEKMDSTYQAISQQCERFYNPLGLSAVSLASAALGTKRLAFVVISGVVASHSGIIMEQIQQNIKDNAALDNQKQSENFKK